MSNEKETRYLIPLNFDKTDNRTGLPAPFLAGVVGALALPIIVFGVFFGRIGVPLSIRLFFGIWSFLVFEIIHIHTWLSQEEYIWRFLPELRKHAAMKKYKNKFAITNIDNQK